MVILQNSDLLCHFGVDHTALLGSGSEAAVYDLSNGRVLRLHKSAVSENEVLTRISLLSRLRLAEDEHEFQIPRVRDHGMLFGIRFTIEDHLDSRVMSEALAQLDGAQRYDLIEDYMKSSTKLANLLSDKGEMFGEIGKSDGIRSQSFKGYLRSRAETSLLGSGMAISLDALISQFPDPDEPELVHLDYYPANVLCSEDRVTAVLDFGSASIAGCGSFNPAIALAFLDPRISPNANHADQDHAKHWLKERGLDARIDAITRWLAAYWSFCHMDDDPTLFSWCRDILGS